MREPIEYAIPTWLAVSLIVLVVSPLSAAAGAALTFSGLFPVFWAGFALLWLGFLWRVRRSA